MSEVKDNLKYTQEHEWINTDGGNIVTIGITDHAQNALGDLAFVELPEIGKQVSKGDEVAVVESVKTASEVYTPVSGEVVEVNEALTDNPGLINTAPYDNGWIAKVKLSNADELNDTMDAAAYTQHIS